MEKVRSVAVLGAGAMGAFFASKFHDTAGLSTSVIARDRRHDLLERYGLVVNGKAYTIPVAHPDAFIGWVLGFVDQAEIVAPRELRDRLLERVGA